MQRLVYSPKVFAYIRVEDQVVDISDYIISGNVTRKIDEASAASLKIRNPQRMFTEPGMFTPMDPITIYLQRLRNRPVRAFTGYIDRVHYMNLYPGPIDIAATCTLKKILNTYWDQALDHTIDFMSKRGWQVEASTGTVANRNVSGQRGDKDVGPGEENVEFKDQLGDGSIGQILHDTLVEVGNWSTDNIFIEKLPDTIVPVVRHFYAEFEKDNTDAIKQYEELLEYIIGTAELGNGGGGELKDYGEVPKTVYCTGKTMNAPKKHLLAAMMIGLVECPCGGIGNPGCSGSGFGNCGGGDRDSAGFRQERQVHAGRSVKERRNVPSSAKLLFRELKSTDKGQSAGALSQDVQRSGFGGKYEAIRGKAESLLRALEQDGCDDDKDEESKATGNDRTGNRARGSRAAKFGEEASAGAGGIPTRSARAQATGNDRTGETAKPDEKDEDEGDDGKYAYPLTKKGNIIATISDHKNRAFGNWMSDEAVDISSDYSTKSVAVEDGKITRTSGSWNGGRGNPDGFTVYMKGKSGCEYAYMHHIKNLVRTGQSVKKGDTLGEAGMANGVKHLHFAAKPPCNPEKIVGGSDIGDVQESDGGGGGGANAEEVLAISKATAFATELQWPGVEEMLEAAGLQGQKSLMNDVPLFPWIQQLAGASMRSIQSMPNGDFFAFYPDQFGLFGHRKPYWLINDIEILDGTVDISDEALATHVYIVGDTQPGGGIDMMEKIASGGVMSIFNLFATKEPNDAPSGNQLKKDRGKRGSGKVNPTDPTKDKMEDDEIDPKVAATLASIPTVGNMDDAVAFLQRYGARPYYEELTAIRNSYFESFIALHKFLDLWSQQFLSDFTFTFMPELFPGGQVGFPDHALQMYIDEVSHEFDYESGFVTRANLSAPSIMEGMKDSPAAKELPPNMVHALDRVVKKLEVEKPDDYNEAKRNIEKRKKKK